MSPLFETSCPEKFQIFVGEYFSWVFVFFRNRCDLEFQTSLDLAQETFLKVFEKQGTFNPEKGSIKTWLARLTRNVAIDHLRKQKRAANARAAVTMSPQTRFEDHVTRRVVIHEALEELPDRQREVLEMKYFWDLSCEEIAQSLQIPVGTVKSDLCHGRRALLSQLEKDFE